MSLSRSYMLAGALYLLCGIGFGIYMSITGNHVLAPLHAHINLLGFVLMTVFGLVFHVFPAMAASILARVQFWLHQAGALTLPVMLFLLLSGRITEASMVPAAPLAELAILATVLLFGANLWLNGFERARVAGAALQPAR